MNNIKENLERMRKEQEDGKMIRGSVELITETLITKNPCQTTENS